MQDVLASFERARQHDFARRFYDRFLAADPAIRRRFRDTEFDKQRDLLIHAVYAMIEYSAGKPVGKMALERLCKSHGPSGMRIPPSMYGTWLRCFLATLAQADPMYDREVEQVWKHALSPGLERLRACSRGEHRAAS